MKEYKVTSLDEAMHDFVKFNKNKTEYKFLDGGFVKFYVDYGWIFNNDHGGKMVEVLFKNRIHVENIFGKKLEKILNMDLINFCECHIGGEYHIDCAEKYPQLLNKSQSFIQDYISEDDNAVFDAVYDFTTLKASKGFKINDYLQALNNG